MTADRDRRASGRSGSEGNDRPALEGDEGASALRGRYLDYCSARIADILLRLTPDEMYLLARDAARESSLAGPLDFDEVVALATARVSRKLALPTLEEWIVAYRENPEAFEPFFLGLWQGPEKERTPPST